MAVRRIPRNNQPDIWYNNTFSAADEALTARQKQLLYECEEERMVVKACLRELIKLKKSAKHTSWDTAEAANMSLSWKITFSIEMCC